MLYKLEEASAADWWKTARRVDGWGPIKALRVARQKALDNKPSKTVKGRDPETGERVYYTQGEMAQKRGEASIQKQLARARTMRGDPNWGRTEREQRVSQERLPWFRKPR